MTATPVLPASGRVERPGSVRDAADLLRDTSGPLLFRGGGTKMGWGGRPQEPALVLETGGLARLLAHEPADLTASVEAGMPLRALQEAVGEAGQWLAIDPPTEDAGATVGGLLVANDAGPRRLRYGAMRDLVIGVTIVLADGTVARAGGHVIKNVAGYDLSKLVSGSLGTLGLLAEVVVRLHPLPEASASLVASAPLDEATALALRLLASPLEPTAVEWTSADGGRLAVRFEGSSAGVDAQQVVARSLCAEAGLTPELLDPAREAELWRDVAAAHAVGGGRPDEAGVTVAAAGTVPSRAPEVGSALREAGEVAGVATALTSHLALGLHTATFAGAPEAAAAAFASWRRHVLGISGSVLLRDRPPEVDDVLDATSGGGVLGPPPSSVAVLRSLKSRLDPDGRCAPGRFGSWY